MKARITVLAILVTFMIKAQEYNKWSIEPSFGYTYIDGLTNPDPYNVQLTGRYMTNTKFGVKLDAGYTHLKNFDGGVSFYTGQVMSVFNLGRMAHFDDFNDYWTILGGAGLNYTYSNDFPNTSVIDVIDKYSLAFFIDNEFQLSQYLFVKAGVNVVPGMYRSPFDCSCNSSTAKTAVVNINIGLVIPIGPRGKEHADWYVAPPIAPVIIDNTKTIIEKPQNLNTYYNTYNVAGDEYVYFKNDSYHIDKDGLANIEKAVASAKTKITIIAYCSNVASVEYNLKLANNRANAVRSKVEDLGFSGVIEVKAIGIDNDRKESIYDMARRVVLISE